MRFARFGTFSGGIDLPDDKDATLDAPVTPVGRLERLRVPLAPAEAPPARVVVKPGQHVSHGERLAAAECDGQVDVFAPLAGRVGPTVEVLLPADPSGWRRSQALELTELDPPGEIPPIRPRYEWHAADGHSLRLRIEEGSLPTFRPPVVPLTGWIHAARSAGADVLVANVMENTPFVTSDHRLLAERGLEVVRGLAILARALDVAEVFLAVDHRRVNAYRDAVAPARMHKIQTIALAHKYPIGADPMLIKVLTRREVPPGGAGLDVGVAVTDAATCWATYRWVACGQPPTARVVTLAGPRIGAPANLFVPFGADVAEVLALADIQGEAPVVYGPAMTGRQVVGDAVVASAAGALLGLPPPQAGPPTQCIRCGWCGDNCPARLNVAALNDDFELGRMDRARRREAPACVGCGICSYVCPARLPLAERLALLKQAIRREDELLAVGGA